MTGTGRAELFSLLDITGADAGECRRILASPPNASVQRALAALEERLGTFPTASITSSDISEVEWVEALLRFAPAVHEYHLAQGVDADTSAATLADMGLQLRINRRVHGQFGLDTWGWLTLHMAGNLFRLGRLQFHLVRAEANQSSAKSQWVLGVHIPEDGGLSRALVDASFEEARSFFARCFPDKPVATATCDSWMLDPYLLAKLPESNIAGFARRFTVDRCTDAPTDAVYFTFRHRGLENLDSLPRETSLQRVVLERIDDGGTWQLGHGHLAL
ncbi:acyltransferase domain-containing protein [Paenarthrobacter sp. NPDC092416]|uniref:acyltransferase domain-containing protein n=1 Tax=Paenarthrobacter sp. NPDC092416 TaxID=3364386 RepID=UPI0037F916E9